MAWRPFLTNLLGLDGSPESGGLLYSYVQGTSTPLTLYSDAGSTPTTNPVVADSLGQITPYFNDALAYSWTAKTSDGATTLWQANVTSGVLTLTYVNPDAAVIHADWFAMLSKALAWVDVASASSVDLGATTSANVRITGTTTITSLGTAASGLRRTLRFAAALTLTHNATSLILPGGVTLKTAANDTAEFVSLGSGNWLCTSYSRARFSGIVNVKDWGAVGDGVTDDAATINNAIAYAQSNLSYRVIYFPAGVYLVSASLTAVIGNNWHFVGEGRGISTIYCTANDDIITADVRSFDSLFGSIRDLRLQGPAEAATSSVGFRALASTGSATGVQYWTFDFDTQNVYKGMLFDETGMDLWVGTNQISAHGFNKFTDFETLPQTSTNPTYIAIEFVGSLNLHNVFEGGRYRGSHRAFKAGKDQTYCSVGDTIFMGVHFLAGTSGVGSSVELIGGSDASCYNENVTMVGCQFECSVAPLHLTRMYNCRFTGSNTNVLQPIFVDCDEDSIQWELRGSSSIPGMAPGRNLAINGGKRFWQRGTSFVPGATLSMDDGWRGRRTSNAAGSTYSRQAGFSGAEYCMRWQRDSGNAGTDVLLYGQQIESVDCYELQGKRVNVTCDVRAGANYSGASTFRLQVFTGTGVDEVFNVATGFATGSASVAPSAEDLTTTAAKIRFDAVQLPDTFSELGYVLAWTPVGTAGAADYVEITNIKFEVSAIGTKFENPPIEEEYRRVCRRAQKSFPRGTAPAQNVGLDTGEHRFEARAGGAVTIRTFVPFNTRIRSISGVTVTFYNPAAANAQARDITGSFDCSAIAVSAMTEYGMWVSMTGNASTAAGNVIGFHWLIDAEID